MLFDEWNVMDAASTDAFRFLLYQHFGRSVQWTFYWWPATFSWYSTLLALRKERSDTAYLTVTQCDRQHWLPSNAWLTCVSKRSSNFEKPNSPAELYPTAISGEPARSTIFLELYNLRTRNHTTCATLCWPGQAPQTKIFWETFSPVIALFNHTNWHRTLDLMLIVGHRIYDPCRHSCIDATSCKIELAVFLYLKIVFHNGRKISTDQLSRLSSITAESQVYPPNAIFKSWCFKLNSIRALIFEIRGPIQIYEQNYLGQWNAFSLVSTA